MPEAMQRIARLLGGIGCFAAGTSLLTADGARPIEAFQPGDLLLSRDENDPHAPVTTRAVEAVFVRSGYTAVIRVSGHDIETTAEHPFYVSGVGWREAGRLLPGDVLGSHNDVFGTVECVTLTGEYKAVYNLRVADWHTYFVGGDDWGFSVWAHNTCRYVVVKDHGEYVVLDTFNKSPGFPNGRPVSRSAVNSPSTGIGPNGWKTEDEARAAAIELEAAYASRVTGPATAPVTPAAGPDGPLFPGQISAAQTAARDATGTFVDASQTATRRPGHALSAHGVDLSTPQGQANVMRIRNDPNRTVWVGVNERGEAVTIYYANDTVLITAANDPNQVLTMFGRDVPGTTNNPATPALNWTPNGTYNVIQR